MVIHSVTSGEKAQVEGSLVMRSKEAARCPAHWIAEADQVSRIPGGGGIAGHNRPA
jgi:hypothetical protein